jgi:Cof subfamily protein (haloacid dehalogenase superfamily)
MELVVFDLDGTLLNRDAAISDFTRDTLRLLAKRDIAYTVATGRTLHASRDILSGHGFRLPHVFKNGVVIWHPEHDAFSHRNVLTPGELARVVAGCMAHGLAPFVFTIEGENEHAVYHAPLRTKAEQFVVNEYKVTRGIRAEPLESLPDDADISNVSAIGSRPRIEAVIDVVRDEPHLVAYSGIAVEDKDLAWLDVHHSDASKGGAVVTLKEMLGAERIVCFGDSDNDISMFERADECYAPSNAKGHVKERATEVIGHHDEDGIARFLRERFSL